jgi:phage terminase large subunit-like protein
VTLGVPEPRVRLAPHAAENSWQDVVDLAAAYGLVLDEWQENVLEGALGERRDGQWAASRVGVSVPRQNGKGGIIEARELAGLLLFDERLLIHSAHEVKTAMDGFRRVRGYFENYDDLRKKVRRIVQTNGQEGIELTDGSALRFMARSKGSGRGFSADCLILDEAQELSDDTFSAILPTISARPNPQVWLLGTPPSPSMNGDVFGRFRSTGMEGKDSRLFWAEWSAEGDVDLDDPRGWAQANPALGTRIDVESIADERSSMADDTFARERLGMWAGTAGRSVISPESWAEVADTESVPSDRFALAVDVAPDRSVASVGFAGQRPDGTWHVELDEQRSGVGWLAPYVIRLVEANPQIRAVVIDGASPAASILDDLARAKIKVTTTNARDMAASCGTFYDGVMEGWLRHIDQPQLNLALSVARKRSLGDAWAWNRKNAASDITPLVAVTLALWGAQNSTVKKPTKSAQPRRVVVLQ